MKLDFTDLLILTGLALLIAGLWLIYFPLALIVAGVLLIFFGLVLA